MKIDKRAAELKQSGNIDVRKLDRVAGMLDRAQKVQRLAKGLSATGETEEQIRAESEAGCIRPVISASF